MIRYYYKYIVNGQWRHSTASPAERDDRGNVNNVILVGDTANVRPVVQQQKKVGASKCMYNVIVFEHYRSFLGSVKVDLGNVQDANIVKVIERSLTESERFMLAKAARCIAFSICPIRLAPK